jgi:predicted permease
VTAISAFTSISIMLLIILIGVGTSLKYPLTNESKKIFVSLMFNVAVPSLILNGIFHSDYDTSLIYNLIYIFVLSIVICCLGIGTGWIIARVLGYNSVKTRNIAVLSGLGNTGFIGIPLCQELFGPTGGLFAATYDSAVTIVIFTLVIALLRNQYHFTVRDIKPLLNVPFLAILISIWIIFFNIQPPLIVMEMTAVLAGLAVPLGMLYIGMLLPSIVKKKDKILDYRNLCIILAIKLVIFPLIVIFILSFLPLPDLMKRVIIIQVAMPTFMLAPVVFAKYAVNDEAEATLTTVVSTIIGMSTVTLIVFIGSKLI